MRRLVAGFCVLLWGCDSSNHAVVNKAGLKTEKPAMLEQKVEQKVEQHVNAALEKAAKLEALNAFIHIDADGARHAAKALDQLSAPQGELHGMLLAVKDNIHVAGLPNSAGTPALKNFIPNADNPVVQKLKDAGAIVLGKANMHELAFGITSDNAAFGSVQNPLDRSKFAGGSSGGTAVAIAAGLVDAGLGTDTGGSVRIPAALTGITGFRPSSNRYPGGGVTPVSHTRDTVGPLARTVSDLVRIDSVITGETKPVVAADLGKIRLGIDRSYYFSQLDPDTQQCMNKTLVLLEKAGVTIVSAEVPQLSELLAKSGFPIAIYESVHELPVYLNDFDTGVSFAQLQEQIASPDVQGMFAAAMAKDTAVPEAVYQAALQAKQALTTIFEAYFAEHSLDAMVFPTTKLPARDIEGSMSTVLLNGQQVPTFPTYIHNTDPASIAGLPGVSLPAGTTPAGLPIGLELDGPANHDRQLLGIALAIEEILGNGGK